MVKQTTKILVVDDDIQYLLMMQEILNMYNFEVITACNGQEALKAFKDHSLFLVLLDIMLPDIDGYTLCKNIRSFSNVPIIMVSGKDTMKDEISGLAAGADDYIAKPFLPDKLIAHIRTVLRRTSFPEIQSPESYFECGDLRIDFMKQTVTVSKEVIDLSATEYRILAFLSKKAGEVVFRNEIINEIWGEENEGNIHSLEVNLSRLRHKLHDPSPDFKYIKNRYGQGYLIRNLSS
jgi:DNA-binding response OmpR family regulator